MNIIKGTSFPESEAWAASMPDLSQEFSSSSPRKPAAAPKVNVAHDVEYNAFAQLDLSNM